MLKVGESRPAVTRVFLPQRVGIPVNPSGAGQVSCQLLAGLAFPFMENLKLPLVLTGFYGL